MHLSCRSFLAALLAISCAVSLPVEAKHHTAAGKHHAATSHAGSAHSSHSRAASSGRSATHVSRSKGRSGKHSIIATSHKRGRHGRAVQVSNHVVLHAAPAAYPEPHADNVQNSNSLANVYRLYDRGVNERLEGRYEQATKTLREASNSYSSAQRGLTLEAMIEYELGQAAEANNNYSIAADAYSRSLRIKPNLIEASVRLASMLMKAGHPQAALSRARDSVAINPNDPRAHQILALILDNNGLSGDAKIERESADRLLRSRSSINYADVPIETNVEPPRQPVTDQSSTPATTPDSTPAFNSASSPDNPEGGNEDEIRKARQEEQWKLYQRQHGETPLGANEDEVRRSRQEQQWKLYQQQHGQPGQSNQRRTPDSDRRPFQSSAPRSPGEFYRARVEPAGKPSSSPLEKREFSEFSKDSATKTFTPDKATESKTTKQTTPEPVDNNEMP
ncbi:hypothetical protein BH10CYA1_BH10CYA1_11730 [soil metagenome]